MEFQELFIKAQSDLRKIQQTSLQGGYSNTGGSDNAMEIPQAFANLSQVTAEDRAAVTNLTTAKLTLSKQVALYANRLSTKEAYNAGLHTAVNNPQGEVKISRQKSPTSRGQFTTADPAPPKTRGEY